MSKLVTDRQIFECIYSRYQEAFHNYEKEAPSRSSKIYVPIDVDAVAKELATDPHELFGRLYYHLDQKYRYEQPGGVWVHLFAFQVGGDRHAINYPFLVAILSGMRQESSRENWSLWLSILSLIVAVAALAR
jgi:hypothetical protein